jgi:D-tyrosyl-tRNA(Tyr) deacylase
LLCSIAKRRVKRHTFRVISFRDIVVNHGDQEVLDGVSFQLNSGERVGIVGPNGAGKSTIFRLIMGEMTQNRGELNIAKGLRIGYLHQELSFQDIRGSALVVSQFTLYADTRKGNRPGFTQAALPEIAEALYTAYVEALRALLGPDQVATGIFRTSMSVEILNDGPVTIELTTDHK